MGAANAVNTGPVMVTCTNGTFQTGWDNSNPYFDGKGNIAALYCDIIHHTGYVSDNLTDATLRYYQGLLPVDIPTPTPETHTVQVPPSQETSTSPSLPQETETPVNVPETQTAPVAPDSPTVVVPETPTPLETLTPVETTTPVEETGTVPVEPLPLPIQPPAVEPQPVPVVIAPQPEPQPQPEPAPEPVVIPEAPPIVEVAPEPAPPALEEQPPADAPSEPPAVEDTNEIPSDPAPEVQPEPVPEPSPEPAVEPEPKPQPDIAYIPPVVQPETPYEPPIEQPQVIEASKVDLTTLSPDTPVLLDNGVVLTAEVVLGLQMLEDPAELLSELFTDPGAVIAALGTIGADMSPKARQESKDAVVSAVIVGSIITQAAGAAAYRRNP